MITLIKDRLVTACRKTSKFTISILILLILVVLLPLKNFFPNHLKSSKYIQLVDVQVSQAIAYQEKIVSGGKLTNNLVQQILPKENYHHSKVGKIVVKENDFIQKGQTLLFLGNKEKIDQMLHNKAQLQQKYSKLEQIINNNQTYSIKSQTRQNKALYKSLLSTAQTLKEVNSNLEKITVKSNVTGILSKLLIKENELIDYNQPLAKITDYNNLKIITEVSTHYEDRIKPGTQVLVNHTLPAYVTKINTKSQLLPHILQLEISLQNPNDIPLNDHIHLKISTDPIMSHRINWSAITLKNNVATIKSINHNKQIVEHNVDIIAYDEDGIWISGLPDKINIVVLDSNLVAAGHPIYTEFKK